MYLYIDPSVYNSIRLTVFYPDHEKDYIFEGKNRELLSRIIEIFDQEKVSFGDLEGIVVLVGSGGFSSTRIASVVANTLSFTLQIPVVGVTAENKPSLDTIYTLFTSVQNGIYLSPTYSGEPNIGPSSHS